MSELISVIITSYKRMPEIVLRAVNSVLAQTYSDIEIIVVDDSPAEWEHRGEVKAAIEGINDSRVIYLPNDKNMGACASRNRGMSIAKGSFYAFLDDDDEYVPEKLEKQLAELNKDPQVGLVYCATYLQYDGIEVRKRWDRGEGAEGNILPILLKGNEVGSCSFPLIRKECFENCGEFDVNLPSSQDHDMWIRISEKYSIKYVSEPLVVYHLHSGESIGKKMSFSQEMKVSTYLLDKYKDLYALYPESKRKYLIESARKLNKYGAPNLSKQRLNEAAAIRPLSFKEKSRFRYTVVRSKVVNVVRKIISSVVK